MRKLFVTAAVLASASFAATSKDVPTFSKDIAPILYQRCVECHRPGEAAPMSLRTYKEARPWAGAIKEAVAGRTMPPWMADPKVNHFRNDRRLSDEQVATIVKWASNGAPEGNASDMPKLPDFTDGWVIGKPDLVVDLGKDFNIPAQGVVQYQYFTIDPGFTEDMWVQAAEVRPSQRAQVHHILVFVQDGKQRMTRAGEMFSDMLIGYAPGVPSITWDSDTGFLVKKGSKLLLQVHYTTNGKEASDRSKVGFIFRKDKPAYRAYSGSALQFRLNIPPNEPNYQTEASYTFREPITMLDLTPHMHLRGKAFKYVLTYPDGHSEELLNVPHYDFNWQLSYILEQPRQIPAGARLDVTAWYDNSVNNKYNPNPNETVRWGDQTFQEMMIGFFNYKVPVDQQAPEAPQQPGRQPTSPNSSR